MEDGAVSRFTCHDLVTLSGWMVRGDVQAAHHTILIILLPGMKNVKGNISYTPGKKNNNCRI